MKHLFKPERIRQVIIILAIFLIVKFMWVVVTLMWLPPSGVEYSEEKGGKNLYYRVRLASNSGKKKTIPTPNRKPIIPQANIKDIDLLAVYSAQNITVVTVKHKNKTSVLSTGEIINGFVLEGGGRDFATFSKNGKLYKVILLMPKKNKKNTSSISTVKDLKRVQKESGNTKKEKQVLGEIVDAGDHKMIDKTLISHYANNMDDIFKDIGIRDLKEDGKLEGFQVSFVRRGSHFSKLGLQKGDIIKSVNGQKISSYNAAFGIYKKIENINNMTLVIIRDNKEMELEYEVN